MHPVLVALSSIRYVQVVFVPESPSTGATIATFWKVVSGKWFLEGGPVLLLCTAFATIWVLFGTGGEMNCVELIN